MNRPRFVRQGDAVLGLIAVIGATAIWSFGAVLGRSVGPSGVVTTTWRLWMGVVLWWSVMAGLGHLPDRATLTRTLKVAAPAGVLFGGNLTLFFTALEHTTIANASIIGALTPIAMLPLAVVLLKERLDVVKIVCALVAVAGVAAAVLTVPEQGGGQERTNLGDGLAVASLVLWVCYLLATKHARRELATVPLLASVTTVAALVVTPLAIFGDHDLGSIDGRGWLWLVLLTVGPGAIGHAMVAWAQPHVDASVSSVLLQGEPVGSTFAAAIFLGESIGGWQVGAMAVVVAALATLAVHSSRAASAMVPEAFTAPEPGATDAAPV